MMDRAQFMQELEKLLADISETERQDALDFFAKKICHNAC